MSARQRRMVLLWAMAALPLAACERLGLRTSKPVFHSTDITGAGFARRLELPDVDGRVRTLADWKGKVLVVFFGYTHCPDVCPATLAELATIRQSLGGAADKLAVVFVTLDPKRDTAPLLKAYSANFGPWVTALRGDAAQTAAAAKEFKVFYEEAPGKTPGEYTLDHSAASFVFDTNGKVRLFVPYGGESKNLAADLEQLIAAA
ncbi:MAG: SCO family protein [Pseudomonadota bacterium]|nr:SCO family protein [Pseudomonadota bacterium]